MSSFGLKAGFAALIFGAAIAFPALAQEQATLPSPIVTLDQERLFNSSSVAERIRAEIETRTAELTAENRRIEAQLEAEELDLTERRPALEPAVFRQMADAFDAKVQGIRAAQDAKARELQRLQEQGRQDFLRQIRPILTEIVRERGAVAVMDRRAVLLSADSIDITDQAISRFNATFDAPETPDLEETMPVPTPDSPDNSAPEASPDVPVEEN